MLTAGVAGCSLLDPLDGISDGAPTIVVDGGLSDSGPPDGAPQVDGSNVVPKECPPDQPELEPNDDLPVKLPPEGAVVCGYVSSSDVDRFTFNVTAGQAYALRGNFDGPLSFESQFSYSSPDGNGLLLRMETIVDASAGGTVSITITSQTAAPRRYVLSVGPP